MVAKMKVLRRRRDSNEHMWSIQPGCTKEGSHGGEPSIYIAGSDI